MLVELQINYNAGYLSLAFFISQMDQLGKSYISTPLTEVCEGLCVLNRNPTSCVMSQMTYLLPSYFTCFDGTWILKPPIQVV